MPPSFEPAVLRAGRKNNPGEVPTLGGPKPAQLKEPPRALNDWMKIAGRSRLLQRHVRLAGSPDVGGGSVPRPSATQALGALNRTIAILLEGPYLCKEMNMQDK